MNKYQLDFIKFKSQIIAKGYKNLAEFAAKNSIHRNTLRNLLAGQPVFLDSFSRVAEILEVDPLELIIPHAKLPSHIKGSEELAPIVARLLQKEKKMAIVLVGSQARKRAKKYSDWDIGIFRQPIPISGMEYLKLKQLVEDMGENNIRQMDLINLNQAPSWFLESLKEPLLFLEGNRESYCYLQGLIDGIQKENKAA